MFDLDKNQTRNYLRTKSCPTLTLKLLRLAFLTPTLLTAKGKINTKKAGYLIRQFKRLMCAIENMIAKENKYNGKSLYTITNFTFTKTDLIQ